MITKKHPTTRSIPPPIDLSVSGSNLRRTDILGFSGQDRTMGGRHPYSRYIIELDDGTSPVPTSTPHSVIFSPSLTPGPTQALSSGTSGVDASTPTTSTSTASLLSPSAWDNTRLVPNRRRRSYSESAYSPEALSSTQRSVSGPVNSGASSTPKGNESPKSTSSNNHGRSLRTSPSFHLGLGIKPKGYPAIENPSHQQRPSTGGKRNKLWSSITHFPLSAGFTGNWDLGHSGDSNEINTPRKKVQRPGTSPSTPSSWVSFTDQLASSSALGRVGSFKKRQRPATASSAVPSSSPPPFRSSKLEWHWQWPGKRLSRFKAASSSSISLTPVQTTTVSPSTTSLHSSPSPLSASLSASPASLASPSPHIQPTTPKKVISQTLRTKSSFTRNASQENNTLTVLPSPNSRNRSTPNLQAPDLSMEDLGKVNALYAPPPPALAVQALGDTPRRRAVSSGPKSKPRLPLPPTMPLPLSKDMRKPLPVPIQTSVSTQRISKGQGIPIALPLSPIRGPDGGWDSEEEIGVIYLTVEDVLDEESGEAMLRLVEIPK